MNCKENNSKKPPLPLNRVNSNSNNRSSQNNFPETNIHFNKTPSSSSTLSLLDTTRFIFSTLSHKPIRSISRENLPSTSTRKSSIVELIDNHIDDKNKIKKKPNLISTSFLNNKRRSVDSLTNGRFYYL
jgi:hypothetical protein